MMVGSIGGGLPFGSAGYGEDLTSLASNGVGYGVGGGGASRITGGTAGGDGAPGLLEARWVA